MKASWWLLAVSAGFGVVWGCGGDDDDSGSGTGGASASTGGAGGAGASTGGTGGGTEVLLGLVQVVYQVSVVPRFVTSVNAGATGRTRGSCPTRVTVKPPVEFWLAFIAR